MRAAKYLILILLVFVSGCSSKSGEAGQSTSELVGNTSPAQSFNLSEFPPSDWPEENIVYYEEDDGKIIYQEGIYSDRFWTPEGIAFCREYGLEGLGIFNESSTKTEESPISKDYYQLVPDKETAIVIVSAICYSQGLPPNYMPDYVFFDTKDELWIVVFTERDVGYASASATIALRKDNAQILAIWSEPS